MALRTGFNIAAVVAGILVMTGVSAAAGGVNSSPDGPSGVFHAGAATSNITPSLDEAIIGGWNSPPARHVHDELHARCLVLDDGYSRLAFVVCDILGMDAELCDLARRMIADKTGIPRANVMIAATHTHSSIRASNAEPGGYRTFLMRRMADGVRRAVNNLAPARVGWGCGFEPNEVFNRRYYMKPGVALRNPFGGLDKVRMNPPRGSDEILEAAGPTDPQVPFLSVQGSQGRPIGLLACYSLHYVGPGTSAVLSADYFGVFTDRVQQLLGADRLDPPFVGIMTNGTSGDINNINWLEKSTRRRGPYEKMNEVGRHVAAAVHRAHQEVEFRSRVELGACARELRLAVRKPTVEQLAYARTILARPENIEPYHRHEKTYARRVLQLDESPDEVSILLQAFRVGDVAVCAIPFEVFVEIGLEIKAKSPFESTLVISQANGSYGYLPTEAQHELGGYETWLGTNRVEFTAATRIVRQLLEMLAELKRGASAET